VGNTAPGSNPFGQDSGPLPSYNIDPSEYPSFCVIRIDELLGFPYFNHKGPSGTEGYPAYTPRICKCSDTTGNSTACNEFNMISGFVLFDSTDLEAIIEFAVTVKKLGDLNEMVFNATYASLSFANGQNDPSQRFYALTGYNSNTTTYQNYHYMGKPEWRKTAYRFCGRGCLGLVAVNFFDTYSTAVNGDYHQVVNGSCRDTFTLNESAWQSLYANPPTILTQDYWKCRYLFKDNVINAIGVGSGTAGALVPLAIIVFSILIEYLGFRKAVLRSEMYTARELDKATEYWASHLLILRDIEETRKNQGIAPSACTRDFIQMLEESDCFVEELDEDVDFYKRRAAKAQLPEFLKTMKHPEGHGAGRGDEEVAGGRGVGGDRLPGVGDNAAKAHGSY
jgi:hypothetical protein